MQNQIRFTNQPGSPALSKQAGENTDNRSGKSSPMRWITVDENEFNHIQNLTRNKGGSPYLEILERRGGLSIIQLDEAQILELSSRMHGEFHKCAGFMSHETLEAARLSINETLQAESNQQAVEYTINNQANVNPMIAETRESQILEVITRLSTDFPNRRYNQPSGLNRQLIKTFG